MDHKDKALFDQFNTAFNSSRTSYEEAIVVAAKSVIAAAVAAEREACAKIADEYQSMNDFRSDMRPHQIIAAAIRSRSSEGE